MSSTISFEGVLERVDSAVADHFKEARDYSAGGTSSPFDPLLTAICRTAPIAGPDVRPSDELLRTTDDFSRLLPDFTYCVASYWAPGTHGGRHSTCHSVQHHRLDTERMAATALFFAMSHRAGYGEEYNRDKWYTATHYLVEIAKNKVSVPIAFSGKAAAFDPKGLWTVPSDDDHWLAVVGWEPILTELVRKFETKIVDAVDFVRAYTQNDKEPPLPGFDIGVQGVTSFKNTICSDKSVVDLLGKPCAEGLRRMWNERLSDEQAAFMVASYLLWQKAVPDTRVAYTFPCHVQKTVCVLTAGVEDSPDDLQKALMSWLSKTLFIHPLISDYAKLTSQRDVHAAREMMRQGFGHNLSSYLVEPAKRMTAGMAKSLELFSGCLASPRSPVESANGASSAPSAGDIACSKAVEGVRSIAERQRELQLLLDYYGGAIKFLADPLGDSSVIGQAGTERTIAENTEPLDLETMAREVDEFFTKVVKPYSGFREFAKTNAKLVFRGFEGSPYGGNRELIREFLVNLVKNAGQWLDEHIVGSDPRRAVIELEFRQDEEHMGTFTVRDHAGGFLDEGLVRTVAKRIESVSVENVEKEVRDLLAAKTLGGASQYKLGQGLIVTCGYLRLLEKISGMGRPGRLDPKNHHDGAEVKMYLPLLHKGVGKLAISL